MDDHLMISTYRLILLWIQLMIDKIVFPTGDNSIIFPNKVFSLLIFIFIRRRFDLVRSPFFMIIRGLSINDIQIIKDRKFKDL